MNRGVSAKIERGRTKFKRFYMTIVPTRKHDHYLKFSSIANIFALFFLLAIVAGCGSSQKVSTESFELSLSSLERETDTVSFHIGSPLFLVVDGVEGRGCEPENGQFFIFSEREMQLNWGFREVSDSILLPRERHPCVRYLMLSSEESNALAEGYYKVSVALLLDEKNRRVSDTIILNPIHAEGASESSFSQFLLEQIVTDAPLLSSYATVEELFSGSLPRSASIFLYEAFLRYRMGDITGALEALDFVEIDWKAESPANTYVEELQVNISKLLGL